MREADDQRSDTSRGQSVAAGSKAIWETPVVIRSALPLSEAEKTSVGPPELHNGPTTLYS
jgi:hypothetical protein